MSADGWLAPYGGQITLPGRVLGLQSNALGNVWAVIEVERRWWEFWRPRKRQKIVPVKLPKPPVSP